MTWTPVPAFRYADLSRDERMALICACGECPVDPGQWQCESSRDEERKGIAADLLARLRCRGETQYGHGLTATYVHNGQCCIRQRCRALGIEY